MTALVFPARAAIAYLSISEMFKRTSTMRSEGSSLTFDFGDVQKNIGDEK